jgi:hypothetical protein
MSLAKMGHAPTRRPRDITVKIRREYVRHGHARAGRRSPLYSSWNNLVMSNKCCTEWKRFDQFLKNILEEIGPKPEGAKLVRTDKKKNWEPKNVQYKSFI